MYCSLSLSPAIQKIRGVKADSSDNIAHIYACKNYFLTHADTKKSHPRGFTIDFWCGRRLGTCCPLQHGQYEGRRVGGRVVAPVAEVWVSTGCSNMVGSTIRLTWCHVVSMRREQLTLRDQGSGAPIDLSFRPIFGRWYIGCFPFWGFTATTIEGS